MLALAGVAMAAVGLVDDVRRLSPQTKLLAQVVLAVVLLQFGFVLRLTGYPLVDIFVTLFWIVGITNAFNLLDNMDGSSASIATVAGVSRHMFFYWAGDADGVRISAAFVGALLGFLIVLDYIPLKRVWAGLDDPAGAVTSDGEPLKKVLLSPRAQH